MLDMVTFTVDKEHAIGVFNNKGILVAIVKLGNIKDAKVIVKLVPKNIKLGSKVPLEDFR